MTRLFCFGTFLIELVFLSLLLPSRLYSAPANGKAYRILLKNGREIPCSHYYERDGQIIVVRPVGEIGYNKDEVVEIREDGEIAAAPTAAPAISRVSGSKPAVRSSTGRCGMTDLWFRAELRRTAPDKLDDLIAQERAKIAELENQLPVLIAADNQLKEDNKRAREARREASRNAQPQRQSEITGESVAGLAKLASGNASIVQGGLSGELGFADPTPAKRRMMEQELIRRRCNLYWAEAKRNGAKTP